MRQLFRGTLAPRDAKTHVVHRLDLPRGASSVRVRLTHPRGHGLGHLVCLGLFDANGFRGSGHRVGTVHGDEAVSEARLEAGGATPGYLAGTFLPGAIRVVLHVHRVVPGDAFPYRLSVEWEEGSVGLAAGTAAAAPGAVFAPVPAPADGPAGVRTPGRRGPGWFRGDLHVHTLHSDGTWTVGELLEGARGAGLDFVAITDHNTTAHLADAGAAVGGAGSPLVVPGMELTTFHGHALALGTRDWIDWGVLRDGGLEAAAADVDLLGGRFVIAHPCADGDPVCTGCDWRYAAMMPGPARIVEVWNGPWDGVSNNERALALWHAWLGRGLRVAATAGSDAHARARFAAGVGRDVVRADALEAPALLAAVAAGRLYLSAGPRVELMAAAGGREAGIGEGLPDAPVEARVAWRDCPAGAVVRLVVDGRAAGEELAAGEGRRAWSPGSARWVGVEVRDRDGAMLALTNPVYVGGDHR